MYHGQLTECKVQQHPCNCGRKQIRPITINKHILVEVGTGGFDGARILQGFHNASMFCFSYICYMLPALVRSLWVVNLDIVHGIRFGVRRSSSKVMIYKFEFIRLYRVSVFVQPQIFIRSEVLFSLICFVTVILDVEAVINLYASRSVVLPIFHHHQRPD